MLINYTIIVVVTISLNTVRLFKGLTEIVNLLNFLILFNHRSTILYSTVSSMHSSP